MKKNLLAATLILSLLFQNTAPVFAEAIPEDTEITAEDGVDEEAILEELEALDTPWEVGAIGDAEISFSENDEALYEDEEVLEDGSGEAILAGVALEAGTNGLPVLNITLNGVTLEEIKAGSKETSYKDNTVEIADDSSDSSYENTTIKGRGNSTWTKPKKPFQLKFDKKQELFGQGKAKKWILLANYMDLSHIRNDAAFRLAVQNGVPGALPQGRFIEVCFNGVYEGLYYLTRKVETASIGLSDENGILVEIEQIHTPDDLYENSDNGTVVMLKETVIDSDDPAEQQSVLDRFMAAYNQLENAARDKDWETVQAAADVVSFAKFLLVSDFTGNQDMFGSSCYMFRDGDDDVIHAGPMWDFDNSFGNTWSTFAPEVVNPLRTWAYMDPREAPNSEDVKRYFPLYEYLMNIPEFRELVRSLYRSSVRSTFDVIDDYALYREASMDDAVQRDLDKWHAGNTGSGSVRSVRDFIRSRTAYFDILYGTPQAADGLCTLKGAYKSKPVRAERTEDGFYILTDLDGLVLDVAGAGKASGTAARWYGSPNGTDAQKWLPLENGAIVAKETGLFLTQAEDGSLSIRYADIGVNGKPVSAQSFTLAKTAVSISDGTTTLPDVIKDSEEIPVPTLFIDGIALREGTDYTLETSVSASEVKYVFSGTGEFTGTLIVRTKITADPEIDTSAAYRLRSALNKNKLLTIKDGSLDNKANAQIETASPYLEDLWRFELLSDGTYTIRNLRSGKVLDAEGGMKSNGTNIRQYNGNETPAQRFIVSKNADGSLSIINVNSGKALDVAGARTADGTNVWLYTPNGTPAQCWIPEAVGTLPELSGNYRIVSALGSRDKGLSIAGSSKANNANILIWTASVSKTALWSFEQNADGSCAIKSVWSGRALDVQNTGTKPGSNVQQFMFGSGKPAQKWVVVKNADGTCTIYSVCSGLALDIAGGRNANGANVQIYTPNGTPAQKWILTA